MLREHIARKSQGEYGFTLIELLVVIIIIGILAAIAIPAFLNQRQKATEASVTSELRNMHRAFSLYVVENNVAPTVSQRAELRALVGEQGLQSILPANAHVTGETRYSICLPPQDQFPGEFAIVAVAPLLTDGMASNLGKNTLKVTTSGKIEKMTVMNNVPTTSGGYGGGLCAQAMDDIIQGTWQWGNQNSVWTSGL